VPSSHAIDGSLTTHQGPWSPAGGRQPDRTRPKSGRFNPPCNTKYDLSTRWPHCSIRPGIDLAEHIRATKALRGGRAFRHRNFRLFYVGQVVSLIGTSMQQVAQGWLVLQLTGDPFMLGVIAVAQFGPVIAFGLFGGVLADRLPKRRTLFAAQVTSTLLALVLFALTATGTVEFWHVAALAVLLGIINAIEMPARQAFAIELVGREDVLSAVALISAGLNASRIVGPAVAGLLIAVFDLSVAFLVNGLSFLPMIGAYVIMNEGELERTQSARRPVGWSGVVEDAIEGMRYVISTPLVIICVTTLGLATVFGMNFHVLVPPLADSVLSVGPSGFGFLMASAGLGATAMSVAVAFSAQPRPVLVSIGCLVLGLALLVLAWSSSFPISLAALGVAAAGAMAIAVTANTAIQMAVPDTLRGRVLAVYTTVFAGSIPIGGLIAGWVASRWGASVAFAFGGALTTATALGSMLWLRRARLAEGQSFEVQAAVATFRGLARGPDGVAIDTQRIDGA